MKALITGVLGQDGSYLAEQLLAEGHDVYGMVRRSNVASPAKLVWGDLLDQDSLERALMNIEPDVIFNLAAVTAPGGGWGAPQPPLLADVTGVGVLRLLEAMVNVAPDARLVNASSSAIYDLARYGVYGIAKQFAHEAVVGYRGELHCSNAVLFSHTSPRQEPRFLARRICTAVARGERLVLGDVESRRDWGYAPDYCDAMRVIAEQDEPGDWVVSTRQQHSVREVVEMALSFADLPWADVVAVDPQLPAVPDEVESFGHRHVAELGWKPETGFAEMIRALVAAEGPA